MPAAAGGDAQVRPGSQETGSSTSSRNHSAQSRERFFSQEGQNDLPRHE